MQREPIMKHATCIFFAALMASAIPAQNLLAQEGEEAERAAGGLEEVMVTARRIEESLQDTPISISAFSAEGLEQRNLHSTELLDQVTPNLQFTNNTTLAGNNNSSVVFIRGVGQTDPTATVDPGVGLYIDDVYMGQSVGGTMDFRDISNVEILRGPQGTLFGKNTVGGAVLLTTKEPGDEFGGRVRLGAGSDSMTDVFVALDAPFSDTVKSRWTFGRRTQDGYVTRVQTGEDLGDTDTFTFTGKITWESSERFSGKVQFDYTEADENGNPFVFAASNESATFQKVASADAGCPGMEGGWNSVPSVPLINDDRCANDFQNKGPYANNGTNPIESKLKNYGGSLHLNYQINDAWAFKSVTSHRKLQWEGIRDADNTPLIILHTDYDSDGDQTSQEFQFLFGADDMNGVVGLYWFEEEYDDIVYVQLNPPPPGIQEDSDDAITKNENWALFTQWTWRVSDEMSLTLGGRYTEDTKGSIPDQFNYANPSDKYLPVRLYEDTFTNFSGSATAAYQVSDDAMVYLSYSEGFKGGGWNSHFNVPQTPEQLTRFHAFGPEEVATWEFGFKTDLADNTLRLNGSVFTSDYDDLQFTYRVGVAPYLANAGKASIDGAELEWTWVPNENWTVTGGIGVLDTSVDTLRAIEGTGIGVAVGNKLPFSPDMTGNLGIAYNATRNGWEFSPRVDFFYSDSVFFDANNTVETSQTSSFSTVNLSMGFGPENGNWDVLLSVFNANDELYATGGNSSLTTGSGYAEIAYARPREYFVFVNFDF